MNSGILTKQIETCEQMAAVPDFEAISLGDMPPPIHEKTISTDVQNLYRMANVVCDGFCTENLASMKPGQIVHYRWITKVDLRHMDEQQGNNIVDVGVDLSEFYMSVEWDILEVPAVR
ncbi:uncharacterized protein LOC120780365 [Bactrocera tryoni]|uniref:uncharacterized protein LOC120780365 n=1 Tax=Bactrocera tryoni TaxID=59916 RepID=UPI001A976B60|nr:uncharacterized protein LOC120780365 [Bactrocera tryoni]